MDFVSSLFQKFSPKERLICIIAGIVFIVAFLGQLGVFITTKSFFMPVRGGTYVEGMVGQPISLNPVIATNQIDHDLTTLLYAPLENLLATHETSPDGRVITIKLKEDLFWSDKEPLTSDDILFTIRTIQNPETRSPLLATWQDITLERISELQITLTLPTPLTFFNTTLQNLRVIPYHIFNTIPVENIRLSNYNLEPVGSGPYRFLDFVKRRDGFITEYRFIPNDQFFGTIPFIAHFNIRFYENDEALLRDVQLRRVQGFTAITPPPLPFLRSTHTAAESLPLPRMYNIYFNQVRQPFLKDKNVRKALFTAIDREALALTITNTTSTVLQSPLPLFTPSVLPYDPDFAKRTLAPFNPQDISLELIVPDIDFLTRTAQSIADAWRAVGIGHVQIITIPTHELLRDVIRPRNYEIMLFGSIPEYEYDLFPFWHSSQRFYPGLNIALYQNNEVDRLLETIRHSGPANTTTTLIRALSLVTNDIPALFLYTLPLTYVHTDQLRGFIPSSLMTPSERFRKVEQWYITKVRVIQRASEASTTIKEIDK